MMQARNILVAKKKYSNWSVDVRSGMFICPCGSKVEDDGRCSEGHVSPMRQEAMV